MNRVGTPLTAEEREVLILSGRFLTNEEIAEQLGMSLVKVKNLIHRASVKLGASNRHTAILLAAKRGYVRIDEIFSPDLLAGYLGELGPAELFRVAQVTSQWTGRELPPAIDKDNLYIDVGKIRNTILTRAERDALLLAGHGFTNREIAARLCITVGAVRNTLNKASSKLGARSRGDAIMIAFRQGDILISEVLTMDEILWFLAWTRTESLDRIAELLSKKLEQRRLRIPDITDLARS